MTNKLNKRAVKYGTAIGLFLGAAILAFAISSYFSSKNFEIDNTIGHVFSVNLTGQVAGTEITPGSEQTVNPVMTNTGTEEMYVFVRFNVGTYTTSNATEPVYTYVVDTESNVGAGAAWTRVSTENPGELLFAYGSEGELLLVQPGAALTLPGKLVATSDNTVFSGLSDNESSEPIEAYGHYLSLGGE